MSGRVTLTGLVSDMNWTSLIEDLINARKAYAITPYENSKTRYQEKLSAWQEFNTKLSQITNYISTYNLDSEDGYEAYNYTLSSQGSSKNPSDIIGVSLSSFAQKGTYEINILSLAQKEKIGSDAQTSKTSPLSLSGTFTINGVDVTIDEGDTLLDMASKINNANAGVIATVLNVSDNDFRLILESEKEGLEGISFSDPNNILETIGILNSLKEKKNVLRAGENASFEIDGIPIMSSSNTITDVIPGVTLTLKATTESVPIRLNIDVDESLIEEKVKNLIEKINSVFSFINNQNTYESGSSKPLTGDVNLNMVRQSIVSLAYSEVGENSTYKTLSSIGINFGKDGTLKLDTSKFSSALTSNREEAINILRTFGDSLYEKLNILVDPYTGTLTGIKTGIEKELKRIDEKIGELEERFEREKEMLEKKYAALELLISESNLLKDWMTNQIKAMFKKE